MISHARMATKVAARLLDLEREVASLRAKLVMSRAAVRGLQATVQKNGKPGPRRVDGVDFGDGRPVRVTIVLEGEELQIRQHKSPRVYRVTLAEAVGAAVRRAQVNEVRRERGF